MSTPRLGDDISEEKPILDSRLPDGSRVAAVLPPCSIDGITLTIRKFNTRHFTMADLIENGTLSAETAGGLRLAERDRTATPSDYGEHRQRRKSLDSHL